MSGVNDTDADSETFNVDPVHLQGSDIRGCHGLAVCKLHVNATFLLIVLKCLDPRVDDLYGLDPVYLECFPINVFELDSVVTDFDNISIYNIARETDDVYGFLCNASGNVEGVPDQADGTPTNLSDGDHCLDWVHVAALDAKGQVGHVVLLGYCDYTEEKLQPAAAKTDLSF